MILASLSKLFLDLNASDTTDIHRGGMTGLWMSLKRLERKYPNPSQRPGELTWDLKTTSITLDWRREASTLGQGQDFLVIDWLLKQSFLINQKGLIQFIGSNSSLNLTNQIHNHQAIHDTFLRHNKFYKKEKECSEVLTIEGGNIKLKYRALNWYAHQTFAEQLCDDAGHRDDAGHLIDDYIQIVSWLYPGATVRHAKLDKVTKIEEKTEYAFALLFLPLVCQYFTLLSNSIKRDKKQAARYIIVIPDVSNFETAATRCWKSHELEYQDSFVTNLAEAALKYYSSAEEITSPQNCQVLVYQWFGQN